MIHSNTQYRDHQVILTVYQLRNLSRRTTIKKMITSLKKICRNIALEQEKYVSKNIRPQEIVKKKPENLTLFQKSFIIPPKEIYEEVTSKFHIKTSHQNVVSKSTLIFPDIYLRASGYMNLTNILGIVGREC